MNRIKMVSKLLTLRVGYAKEQVWREALPQSVRANEQTLELSTQLYKSCLADFL